MFPCYSLLNIEVIWLYDLVLIKPYKFMSGYVYFPNNLKDIKDHNYMGLYDDLQNLFPINGNSVQRKPKLIATPYVLQ